MADEIFVQVRFSEDTAFGTFRDALIYPQAIYAGLKQAQIDADKQVRVNDWITRLQNPFVETLTVKDLQDNIAALDVQKAEYQKQIDDFGK